MLTNCMVCAKNKYMNNYKFWKKYNQICLNKIDNLLRVLEQEKVNKILVDLHIHSNHSSDGKQSLDFIIDECNKKGFKIIALTDHDDVKVFNELYKKIKKNQLPEFPIILTGVEQTVSFPAYQTMCHIVKLFINPFDKELKNDLIKLNNSYFNRAKIQIQRIQESPALREIFEKYDIKVSYKEFLKYLKSKKIAIPDYAPLVDYLADKLKEKNVPTKDVYERVKYYNNLDTCTQRKAMRDARFEYLDKKYENIDVQDNRRFLLSILGVRGVDDAYFKDYPSSGSLSVDEYGQVNIFNMNSNGVTIFAHPNETKLQYMDQLKNCKCKFVAFEDNFKSTNVDKTAVSNAAKKLGLFTTVGSDKHAEVENVYDDLSFYELPTENIKKLINEVK